MKKPNTIPDEYEDLATLSAWLRCYPVLAKHPRILRKMPVSDRCRKLYPDLVARLHPASLPLVVNMPLEEQAA